jgi:hypothetical protein
VAGKKELNQESNAGSYLAYITSIGRNISERRDNEEEKSANGKC